MQTTLSQKTSFAGTGLHSGRPARVTLHPAPADHGIVFRRSDFARIDGAADPLIPALWDRVIVSPLNTRIENAEGVSVSTIEHLMAALSGCGVHNVLVEIDGPEVPILDGSAALFARGILSAGLAVLDAPLMAIEVLRPVSVTQGEATARLEPARKPGLTIDFEIDFADAAIGRQIRQIDMANGAFLRELCDSRTFCRLQDVTAMQKNGLALGGTVNNAVVVDGATVLTPGGLRHKDEAVRHKMLDSVGDMATAGAPILGHYSGHRAGHALTNALLRALFAEAGNWRLRPIDAGLARHLPGADLRQEDLAAVA
ncbi:UDP-3-O-acyl-N-acetylglucosamine deacetylase [Pseudoroseicyclus aestuarii]|uniref:UDP-3-O-acyl-N-acetylglucosamine deacetylase n=1 Tax=Pseudoroseicyclus aestuarii TaxID=1795041 RepID=A0A318SNV8_9RHOB|nr:UDP-3-O-acyl-N-acetylglucosamine deacetylase [Pseudoroseicyclus aestuarii]PYE82514.1 UDP-3-O-[3-hydroxymyristoyl] N-acetylglucosamine deacetylase [Pseudoroseicyclus aestuarii]